MVVGCQVFYNRVLAAGLTRGQVGELGENGFFVFEDEITAPGVGKLHNDRAKAALLGGD